VNADSPLRYPGGKASLAGFLAGTIKSNGLHGRRYYEPFAGGAGAGLRLLREGVVSEIVLNELDPGVFAFWRAVLGKPDRFRERIKTVPVTVDEWNRQKEISMDKHQQAEMSFELGFATFYLNRCSRSGIIVGSAPIGGYEQEGEWRIGARFYRETLVKRIRWLKRHKERIHLSNKDAIQFLEEDIPKNGEQGKVLVYLDPPYFVNGHRLYGCSYREEDHRRLADYMKGRHDLKWIMSYDDAEFIRELYGDLVRRKRPGRYSLQDRREASELVIAPKHVELPELQR